ncbi:MAG TPA: NAD(P)-dependent alcohol dehydrogenase [Ktedonobacteraceae bacterium]|jgi:NADPH:quinone reductase-like Zn-dependent oxidoreductase
MKAIVYARYGSADVLQLKEVEKPAPGAGEVLVKICAASANPLDWHLMRAAPIFVRLGSGLRYPKDPRLGADVAGWVEAVGQGATQFRPGDEVFGAGLGSFAEYTTLSEKRLTLKPAVCSFEEAAAVPVAAVTALQGLRDKGQVRPGQKVLVNGASGGVGTFAVQIARALGAEVTGVCSTQNLEMVRSLGAEHVIDYTQEDFTRGGPRYDLIYDAVGNRSVSAYRRALNPSGVCIIAGFQNLPRLFEHMVLGPLRSKVGHRRVGLMGIASMNQQDLLYLKGLLEAGTVVAVIGRRYPLHEVSEAIRYLEGGHARGKVVITVQQGAGN